MPSLLPRSASFGGGLGPPLDTPEARITEALRRTAPKLPAELRRGFQELVSPSSIATTVAVIALWAGSHAVGIGVAADLGLMTFGLVTLGAMAIEVAKHLSEFARLSVGARSHSDLDRASDHLAEAVTILGVALFASLVAKTAPRVGRVAGWRLTRASRLRGGGLTAEEWLYLIGLRRPSPMARRGMETMLRFLSSPELVRTLAKLNRATSAAKIREWVYGMDFSRPVTVRRFAKGERIVGYMQLREGLAKEIALHPERLPEILANLKQEDVLVGRFFTKPGTSTRSLGVRSDARYFFELEVQGSITALESRAAPVRDTWTIDDPRPDWGDATWMNRVFASGGGTQFLLPDSAAHLHSGKLRLVTQRGPKK